MCSRNNIEIELKEINYETYSRHIYSETGGGQLCTRQGTSGFHKVREISRLAKEPLPS